MLEKILDTKEQICHQIFQKLDTIWEITEWNKVPHVLISVFPFYVINNLEFLYDLRAAAAALSIGFTILILKNDCFPLRRGGK